jgi:hypothetical protein
VLITNNALHRRAGSELYVRDLATALLDRGHAPIVYSTVLGEVAQEIRNATIPVVDDLEKVALPPDLVHGHHHLETMTALLHFPDVPAVSFCHGWGPWEESALRHPRILRYIAIDDTCRDRLISESAIPDERVRVILNFVDLKRFLPRGPLPPQPARALVFSNYANEQTHLPAVREACARRGLAVDVMGFTSETARARPEAELGGYDIVFAKGRAALEALAVGAAVVLCDESGMGAMVSMREVNLLRRLNFGIRTLRRPVNADEIARQMSFYDPEDAAKVSAYIRATAGRDGAVDELLRLYEEVLSQHIRSSPSPDAAGPAAAAYLRWLSPSLKKAHLTEMERDGLRTHHGRLQGALTVAQARATELESTCGEARRILAVREADVSRVMADHQRTRHEMAAQGERLRRAQVELEIIEQRLRCGEQEGHAVRQRAAAIAEELSAFRGRRITRLLNRLAPDGDLSGEIGPAFHSLRDESSPAMKGFRLQPSVDLRSVSAVSYPIRLLQDGLRGVMLAPIFDLPPVRGWIGVQIESPDGSVVEEGVAPCTETDGREPARLLFPADSRVAAGRYRLNIFARNAEGPVRIFEWRRMGWRGLGRLQTRAFCRLLFASS